MFGDIILFIKEKWTQFWCIHDSIPDYCVKEISEREMLLNSLYIKI